MRYCGQPPPVSLLQAEHSTASGCLLQTAAVACSTHTHSHMATGQLRHPYTHYAYLLTILPHSCSFSSSCSSFPSPPAPLPAAAVMLCLPPCSPHAPAASPSGGGTAANNSRLLIKAQLAALQRQHAAYSRGYAEFLERHARVMLELILDDASGVEAWQQQRAAQVCAGMPVRAGRWGGVGYACVRV